jgi:ligand-binding sensor domain-containing protein/signal transduction histidine kinase
MTKRFHFCGEGRQKAGVCLGEEAVLPTVVRRELRRNFVAVLMGTLLVAFLAPYRGWALDPTRELVQYSCQTWTVPMLNLPDNIINAVAQTKDGYIWLGTPVGLVRFDGAEFDVLDPASVQGVGSSAVNCLTAVESGGLWVGLQNSAFGFCDGQTFSFRGSAERGKVDLNVQSIMESKDGTLWIAADRLAARLTRGGVYEQLMGSSADSPANAVNVAGLYEDRQGRVWFGTVQRGLRYWQDGRTNQVSNGSVNKAKVNCITQDRDGLIWLGTSAGLRCLDTNLTPRPVPSIGVAVRALLVDREGMMWIGTSGRGLGRYESGEYSFLRKSDGLASDNVLALAEDREGSLWIGTHGGLSQLADVKFPSQNAFEGTNGRDALTLCASRNGGIWVDSDHGLSYYDGEVGVFSQNPAPASRVIVGPVFEASNGDLYLASEGTNLQVYSGKDVVARYVTSNRIVAMVEDPYGVVLSVADQLWRVGRDHFSPYLLTNDTPKPSGALHLASGRDGDFWGVCRRGLFHFKDGASQVWDLNVQGDAQIQSICQDKDGVIWVGLLTGIARLKDNRVAYINRKSGLFDDSIFEIVPDDLGDLWVSSGRGFFRVSRKSMNDFADGRATAVACVAYDGPESVQLAEMVERNSQSHSGCKSLDGRIWFPNPNGVVEIDPAHIPANHIEPAVHIEMVRANGREFDRNQPLVVPPGEGELEFHFSATTFIAPQKVRFRYQLEGYDKDWVDPKNRRLAFYTNLKPGHYKFHVIAANADGVWNKTGDVLEIELRPHFYETAGFEGVCIAMAGGALFGLVAWRVRCVRRKQLELLETQQRLEVQVRSRTSELAQANASLEQKTQSLEHEIEERERMQQEVLRTHQKLLEVSRLAGMSEIASNVLHNVGNVLNSVNVSATLVMENVQKSRVTNLAKITSMLQEHEQDLGGFITSDAKGRQVPGYLTSLSKQLLEDRELTLKELESLRENVEHIKEIVSMQQNYAKVYGVKEIVSVPSLVEDSLRINVGAMGRHGVTIIRDFQDVPPINADKHKILQILINLLSNAKHACTESENADKKLTLRVFNGNGTLKVSVTDNGVGIPPENLTRIFSHGFTTRADGHGFGLHGSALAAKEMGGSLSVHSDGAGRGATFTLELPVSANEPRA